MEIIELDILPFTEAEQDFLRVILSLMWKGYQKVNKIGRTAGTYSTILNILGIEEEALISSIKYRMMELEEAMDELERIIILDNYDRKLFMHTVSYVRHDKVLSKVLDKEAMDSIWDKYERVNNFWTKKRL